ncbi:hypothetical protein QQF64_029904 [Cirrhinus molitorella]|uniref:Secreted protein n=1 Tax=Cirrhinus molitorella TaxID=172907 RepID=A0ABR3N1U2_9TELE
MFRLLPLILCLVEAVDYIPVFLPLFLCVVRGRAARRGIPSLIAGAWLRKVALQCGRCPDDGGCRLGGVVMSQPPPP